MTSFRLVESTLVCLVFVVSHESFTLITDMLQIYNVPTDVRAEAQKVISIFQNEARMKRISLSLNIGESIRRLGIYHIKTDPVRLGQVYVQPIPG